MKELNKVDRNGYITQGLDLTIRARTIENEVINFDVTPTKTFATCKGASVKLPKRLSRTKKIVNLLNILKSNNITLKDGALELIPILTAPVLKSAPNLAACAANACASESQACAGDACAANACAANADACAGNCCAGDACGANAGACAANACGGAACGANADACAVAGCGADACVGKAGAGVATGCTGDACAANAGACAAEGCAAAACAAAASACAADACALNACAIEVGPCAANAQLGPCAIDIPYCPFIL